MQLFGSAPRWVLTALFLGGLLRLVLSFGLVQDFSRGDASQYDRMAQHIATDGVFSDDTSPPFHPTLVRAPLYPGFLALLYKLFGHGFAWPIAVQIVLSLAACYLLGETVSRSSPTLGLLVLWLAALNPFDAVYSITLLSESLATSLLILALCLPWLYARTRVWWFAGVALGAACMVRDVYVLLLPLLAAALLLLPRLAKLPLAFPTRPRQALKCALLLSLGGACVILPWTARNHHATGETVLISKGILGQALWIGTWETNAHWFDAGLPERTPPESCRSPSECDEVQKVWSQPWSSARDQSLKHLALARLHDEPIKVFIRWLVRVPRSWLGTRYEIFAFRPSFLARGKPLWLLVKAGLYLLNAVLIALGLIGFLQKMKTERALLWFSLPVIYTIAIYFPLHNLEIRYTQPAYPFVLVFTAVALAYFYQRMEKRS